MDRVTVAIIRNPFRPLESRETREFSPGVTVGEAIRQFCPEARPGYEWTVARNGRALSSEEWETVLSAGDGLSFCATPLGGGGRGKNPLATLAMIAVAVASAYIAAPIVGAMGLTSKLATSIATAVVRTGVMAVGSLLVSTIFPAKPPAFEGFARQGFENSRTYGWNVEANIAEPGQTLPVLYGKHKVVPPLAARYVETRGDKQYLNMLFAVAGHRVDAIGSIKLNDQPVEAFSEVHTEIRLGTNSQTPLAKFEDQRRDEAIYTKLSTEWQTRQLISGADSFGLGFVAPRGLFYANDQGGLSAVSVILEVQYRKIGSSGWRNFLGNVAFVSGGDFRSRQSTTVFMTYSHNMAESLFVGARIRSYVGDVLGGEHTVTGIRRNTLYSWVQDPFFGYFTIAQQVTEITVTGPVLPEGMSGYSYSNPTTLTGRQNVPKRWFFEVPAPPDGFARYEYRFRHPVSPPTGDRYAAEIYLDYHQEIVSEPLEYPNTALLAVRALATDQLSGGQPRVSCVPERMTTSDGKSATNPAWVSLDMLKDPVNGGGVPASRVKTSRFEAWADQCSQYNLTCNIYFDDPMNLKQALDVVGVLGRGQTVQVGSEFSCITDFPETSVQGFKFGMGNIEAGSFSEEWLSGEDRADVIEVTYWDAMLDWRREVFSIPQAGYNNLTTIPKKQTVVLYGCTNREMAARHVKMLLNKNRYLTLIASWRAGIDALACLPGDHVDVSHDVPQWGASGRIVDVPTSTSVTIDRAVTLLPGKTYVIDVKYADDTRTVMTLAGVISEISTDELELTAAWLREPEKFDIYSFGELNKQQKQFKVLSLTKDIDLHRQVVAIEVVPEVYNDAVSVPPAIAYLEPGVTALRAREAWLPSSDGSGRSVIDVSWASSQAAGAFVVYYRPINGVWTLAGTTDLPGFRIDRPFVYEETYQISVTSPDFPPGRGTVVSVLIRGELAAPGAVSGFQAQQYDGGKVLLSWNHEPGKNIRGYELREGVSWDRGTPVADRVHENEATYRPSRKGTHLFWIKAISNSGTYSQDAASAQINVVYFKELNVVLGQEEVPAGVGDAELVNLALGDDDLLCWIPGMVDLDVPSQTDLGGLINYAGDHEPGEYVSQTYDLLKDVEFSLRIDADYESTAPDATDRTYPLRTDRSFPNDRDDAVTTLSVTDLYFRAWHDGIESPEWIRYVAPVDLVGQYLEIKAVTNLDSRNVRFWFNAIYSEADVPDKEITLEAQAIGAGGRTYSIESDLGVSILVKYLVSPTVLGTAAKYPVINKISLDEFSVALFDAGGNPVSGNIDLTIRGY